MRFSKITLIIAIFTAFTVFIACNHAKEGETNNSAANSTRSHNVGQNCMSCHKKGGEGEGWFSVAGSVFHSNLSPAQNVVVKLYTQPNGQGELKKTIPGDLLGNFYTTDIMGFGAGLYPAVEFDGTVSYMSGSITYGACNSCHGVSTERITID